MTAIVVARGDLSGRETVTRTIRLPAMRAAPHFERAGRTSAIFVTSVVARVRGMSGTGAWNHGRHASIPSAALIPLGSAIRSGLLFPATVFAGSLLPFWRGSRLFLNSVGALTALRAVILPPRFQPRKQSRCGLSKSFRSFSSVLSHGSIRTHGAVAWNEKVLTNLAKVLAKVT